MYALIVLCAIPLLLIVVGRWIRSRGQTVSYFFSRHEHNPDYPDYEDDERPKEYQRDEGSKYDFPD